MSVCNLLTTGAKIYFMYPKSLSVVNMVNVSVSLPALCLTLSHDSGIHLLICCFS